MYRISRDLAMIQTLDFFTPVVDDPYTFGEIAAANALSDVYAMGGEPAVALNIACFPACLDASVLGDILAGGAAKVKEAGAVLAGGHTVQDEEPKYGLSVTGFVRPDRLWTNGGARPGDVLILTKPLGTGLITTGIKAEMAAKESADAAIASMRTLNRDAKRAVENLQVHACTDITGFGLAGHGLEMARAGNVTLEIFREQLPILPGAADLARMGLVPAGAYRNREYAGADLDTGDAQEWEVDLLTDPQTSGGLLLAVDGQDAGKAAQALEKACAALPWAVIGRVCPAREKKIIIR